MLSRRIALAAVSLAAATAGLDARAEKAAAAQDTAEALAERVRTADPRRGAMQFIQCRACHTLGPGEPHLTGPNLHGILGAEAGSRPAFDDYSEVLADAGFTWTLETLDAFIADPNAVLPGTRMIFRGMPDPDRRAELLAYLLAETAPDRP
jgi:cytochrome c